MNKILILFKIVPFKINILRPVNFLLAEAISLFLNLNNKMDFQLRKQEKVEYG